MYPSRAQLPRRLWQAVASPPGRPDIAAVIDVGRDVMPDVNLLQEGVERRVVGLEIIRRLDAGLAVVKLEVRPEPPLAPFRTVLGDGVDRHTGP